MNRVIDNTRNAILDYFLCNKNKSGSDFLDDVEIDIPENLLYHHLRRLREEDILLPHRWGRRVVYTISPLYIQKLKSYPYLMELMNEADSQS